MKVKLSTTTCSIATVVFAIIVGCLVAFKAPPNASAMCSLSSIQSQFAALSTQGRVDFWQDRLAKNLEVLPLNDQQQRMVKTASQMITAEFVEATKKSDFGQSERGQKLEALQNEIATAFTRTQAGQIFMLDPEVGRTCSCNSGSSFNFSCCSGAFCSAIDPSCGTGGNCGFAGLFACNGRCETAVCPIT